MSAIMIGSGYLVVGAAAAMFRAYREPFLIASGHLEASCLSNGKHSLFYRDTLVFHFLAWPLALPFSLVIATAEHFRKRGEVAVAAEKVRVVEAARASREIDRIIAEYKL